SVDGRPVGVGLKGADVVLIHGPDLATAIASAIHNASVCVAIDAVSGFTFTRLAESLDCGATTV
ncbi:MAG: alcohol dehydrogenase, partial [Pseudomonadales bacterium]